MKLKYVIISGILTLFLLVLLVGYSSYNGLINTGKAFNDVIEYKSPAIMTLHNIESNLFFIVLKTNEYVIAPSNVDLKEFEEVKEKIEQSIIKYEKAEKKEEKEEKIISEIKEKTAQVIALSDEIFKLKDGGASQEILIERIRELEKIRDEFTYKLDKEIGHDSEDLKESYSSVTKIIRKSTNLNIIFSLISLLIASVFVLFIYSSIFKQLSKLINGIKIIGNGNIKYRIDIKAKNEMGELATAFNKMSADLVRSRKEIEDYSKNLEKKVQEKTKELKLKNEELEKFNKLAVGRELKMIELKKRIKELEEKK
jgi:methyl-accepting chemotaxis protein